jgi:hypothetical protein
MYVCVERSSGVMSSNMSAQLKPAQTPKQIACSGTR